MNKIAAFLESSLLLPSLLLLPVLFPVCEAQTIHVDIAPESSTNHFRPNETLGAGVDRIPAEAIDHDLVQPKLLGAAAALARRSASIPCRCPAEYLSRMDAVDGSGG